MVWLSPIAQLFPHDNSPFACSQEWQPLRAEIFHAVAAAGAAVAVAVAVKQERASPAALKCNLPLQVAAVEPIHFVACCFCTTQIPSYKLIVCSFVAEPYSFIYPSALLCSFLALRDGPVCVHRPGHVLAEGAHCDGDHGPGV
jgi:hypothetical protein